MSATHRSSSRMASMHAVARRFDVSPSTVSGATRRHGLSAICFFVQGGRGGPLPEPYRMTSSRPLVCMFLLTTHGVRNILHEGGMRARCPRVGPVLTAQHCPTRSAFAREHQDWQILHWRPVLFKDESRFTLRTCDRRDRFWRGCGERSAA